MTVKLLTEHHMEFLGLTGSCRGSSKSTHVKIPHCWKSHALAHLSMMLVTLWFLRDLTSVVIGSPSKNATIQMASMM